MLPGAPDHESFLWGNGAILCALAVGESVAAEEPVPTQGEIGGLPLYVATIDGEAVADSVRRGAHHASSGGAHARSRADATRVAARWRLDSHLPIAVGGAAAAPAVHPEQLADVTSIAEAPSLPPAARWATEPFVMGTPEQFQQLREWLVSAQYTEPALCAATGADAIGTLKSIKAGRTVLASPVDTQSLLVLLFLDGVRLPWSVVRSVLSPGELSLFTDLGLLVPAVADAELCVATVALFPTEDVYVASDRLSDMELIGKGLPSDLVYSPLTAETRRFIGLMPRTPCERYLEMCAGTGIAALHAAKHFATRAFSADITDRCTRFAQFNAALNGLENFEAIQGDLYEPVAGQMFDLITAHPPYVPAESTQMVFRDGGSDGEQITRRIVAGLGDYLKPGGLFYLDCMMTDRRNDPIEQRLRRMLGPSEDEFHVVVVRSGFVETKTYHADQLAAGRMTPDSFLRQDGLFKRLGIERLVAITALIQRRTSPGPVATQQRTLSGETRAAHLLWLVRYLAGTVEWGPDETHRLLDSRPRALPDAELRVRSVLRDSGWVPTEAKIATVVPFASESACPGWFPTLLSRCNGQVTVREHFDQLRADGVLAEASSPEAFAELIRDLADVPFLELDIFPLPEAKSKKNRECRLTGLDGDAMISIPRFGETTQDPGAHHGTRRHTKETGARPSAAREYQLRRGDGRRGRDEGTSFSHGNPGRPERHARRGASASQGSEVRRDQSGQLRRGAQEHEAARQLRCREQVAGRRRQDCRRRDVREPRRFLARRGGAEHRPAQGTARSPEQARGSARQPPGQRQAGRNSSEYP